MLKYVVSHAFFPAAAVNNEYSFKSACSFQTPILQFSKFRHNSKANKLHAVLRVAWRHLQQVFRDAALLG